MDDTEYAEQVEAAAEVAIHNGGGNNGGRRGGHNNNNNANEQAQMGVSADGVEGYQAHNDPSGRLVQTRFHTFLNDYQEDIVVSSDAGGGGGGGGGGGADDNEDEDGGTPRTTTTTTVFPYVEQAATLREDDSQSNYHSTLWVDFAHVKAADEELAEAIQLEYHRFDPFLRQAAAEFVQLDQMRQRQQPPGGGGESQQAQPFCFVAFYNVTPAFAVRDLRMDQIGRLVGVSGTVTRTSDVRPELLTGVFRCESCGLASDAIPQQFHFTKPPICRNPRCKNTSQFTLEADGSVFCDWQKLKLQESSDEIPPGSMPRSLDVYLRHELVEKAKAGDAVLLTGCLVVIPDGSALAKAGEAPRTRQQNRSTTAADSRGVRGLKATGARELTYRTAFCVSSVRSKQQQLHNGTRGLASLLYADPSHISTAEQVVAELSPEQREEIRTMQRLPNLYERLAESLCPTTFGHETIKKGLLLMLLGGVHKTTKDGIKLRGDTNVLIVGDPSTAKSQFLKYIHGFADNCVYTAGKASSSAGLTASVQRDSETGEYCIEAGALMLADNGICCIDEFDKMDVNDQVAIHEAMEQQSITITKAGISATLNARASVLAAANPIHGRYDRSKTLKANVNLSPPILSRFDLFFVVLDECNPDSDRRVAKHILNVHRCQEEQSAAVPFTKEQLQRYIRFAKTFQPKLNEESQKVLVDSYRRLRQSNARSAYRVTVRQLESMIRLSEAMARLHCDPEVQPRYVEEAYRLLRTSIIQVETGDVDVGSDNDDDDDDDNDGNNGPAAANPPNNNNGGDKDDNGNDRVVVTGTSLPLDESEAGPETQLKETLQDEEEATEPQGPPRKKAKRQKTTMSYEEYALMSNTIAAHLRSLEDENKEHLKWKQVIDWYVERAGQDNEDTRRKVNLLLRRLLHKENVLVTIGTPPKSKREEPGTVLAVHPNYVIS